ncbi:helix-turn-helix domain-containing protein [Daejeonella lutea]|uniref:Helix-turn-helix domain-containing protein n=1 Tax=Daejeonella lutea TaxID=572036 RepID=A0A1T5CXE0_9SPHI|nr:helix-turn-helix domain-containing protein [Daejeonella lutea]SKB64165.1 hypothetical protein SAMN05661099_1998 [Daejeonella lutea]
MDKQVNIQEIKQLIDQLQQVVDGHPVDTPALTGVFGELWDDNDLMKYLRISLRTVKRRRKDNTFKGFPIGGRFYYYKQDILKLRDRYLK